VFNLGTAMKPGNADAVATGVDPANSMTAIDLSGVNAYVGFCGTCMVLDQMAPFHSGIATNVGGAKPGARQKSDGWHIAKAIGLPNRYITGLAIDPKNPKTIYASAGGYSQRWTPPGELDRGKNAKIGRGHIFVSHDAGEHFTDISGNLPNTPVNWIILRGEQVIAATDLGVFISKEGESCAKRCRFQVLGQGLPASPIYTVRLQHGDPNHLIAAAFGRGVWSYRFGPAPPGFDASKFEKPKFLDKLIAQYDFETDDQGWVATSTSNLMFWARRPPGSTSGQSFQVTPYADESSASLTSPKLTVPQRSTIRVTWDERRDTEPCCDFLSLDWSSDGKVWTTATSIDGQNPDFPLFTTVDHEFVVPAGSLYIRIRLTSDQLISSPPYTGVAIDNVVIKY
jgi:hypothetical protein